RFVVQAEFGGGTVRLLDGFADWPEPREILGVRAGQYRQPFSSTWTTSPAELMFPEEAPLGEYFSLGRDSGVMLLGSLPDDGWSAWLSVVVGQPVTLADDTEIRDGLGVARLQWAPDGPVPEEESPYADGPVPFSWAVGIDGYYGRVVRSALRL